MDEWVTGTIGDLPIEIIDGDRSDKYPSRLDFLSVGIPFLNSTNIRSSRLVIDKASNFISHQKFDQIKKGRVVANDIVMTTRGANLGTFALFDCEYATALVNAQLLVIRPSADCIDSRFLFYVLVGPELQRRLMDYRTGSAQPQLPIRDLKRIPIRIPKSVPVQRYIANVLGALDDKIELNRRMNATLEAMARALFQSWFVDFDPVRAKLDGRKPVGLDEATAAHFPEHLEETALGHTPQGWEVRSLDKIAHYLNGLALQKYPPRDGPTLPVIKIAQLRKGDSIGADRCNTDLPAEYVADDGDVLFSWSGSLEVELWCGGRGALNQHLFKVTSQEFPKWFYYLWTLYHLDEFRLIAAGKATTMGHIQRGHLTAAKVLIPPPALLRGMTRVMAPLLDRMIANRVQSRTLATLRDALLPKLLSGNLRVPNAENEIFAVSE